MSDTAFHALNGATITVLDGPSAGASTHSVNGQVYLEGVFDANTAFRAEAEGHVTAVRRWNCSVAPTPCGDGGARPWLGFNLAPVEGSIDLAGDYTLTFDADSACTDLPEAVRTRSYAATLAASPTYGVSFLATLAGAPFFKQLQSFRIGVARHEATFFLDGGHDAPVVEQLDTTSYLAFSGTAVATVNAGQDISTPFDGWIEYCVTKTPLGNQYYNCGAYTDGVPDGPLPSYVSKRVTCDSRNHHLTLKRRD